MVYLIIFLLLGLHVYEGDWLNARLFMVAKRVQFCISVPVSYYMCIKCHKVAMHQRNILSRLGMGMIEKFKTMI